VTKLARKDQLSGSGPIRYKVQAGKDGFAAAMMVVDYADAPVPPNYYVADYFEVANLDPKILFTFGKLDYPNNKKLRNKLEIDFPVLLFVAQLWASQTEFQKNLRRSIEQFGYEAVKPGTIVGPVEKVQTMHSNNALMVQSAGECMIDFFYVSPRDMAFRAPRNLPIALEPLVRVITAENFLLGFLDACAPIAETLIAKYAQTWEEQRAKVEF
jgi:hypothetical protein